MLDPWIRVWMEQNATMMSHMKEGLGVNAPQDGPGIHVQMQKVIIFFFIASELMIWIKRNFLYHSSSIHANPTFQINAILTLARTEESVKMAFVIAPRHAGDQNVKLA